MLHWHSIGFIDPRRPIDRSQKPAPPLPIRPVPPKLGERIRGNKLEGKLR
jgi:hypothetical protein